MYGTEVSNRSPAPSLRQSGFTMQTENHDHRKVIVFSGHMIDRSERKDPRFPQSDETAVRNAINQKLLEWEISEEDLGICGGACGGDILFAELCLTHGCYVRLMLGISIEFFLDQSVRVGDANWEDRFQAVRSHPRCETIVREEPTLKIDSIKPEFEENNRWIWKAALTEAYPKPPCILVLWDEKPCGDGAGGTSHFVSLVKEMNYAFSVVNPILLLA